MTEKQIQIEIERIMENRLQWEESRQQWHDDFLLKQKHWVRQQIMWAVATVLACLSLGVTFAKLYL